MNSTIRNTLVFATAMSIGFSVLWFIDRSARRLKGDPRPIKDLELRAVFDPELANYQQFGVYFVEQERDDISAPIIGFQFRSGCPSDRQLGQLNPPRTLRRLIFRRPKLSQVGLEQLLRFPSLEVLEMDGADISELSCGVFRKIETLKELKVSNTRFGDDALASLDGHLRLEVLNLANTQVTDMGFRRLNSLPELKTLVLAGTDVGRMNNTLGDFGLFKLPRFTKLKHLGLAGTRPGEGCLGALAKCKSLELLDLTKVPISDADVEDLSDCKSLVQLTLHSSSITDIGVRQLAKLSKLRRLTIYDSSITATGIEELGKLQKMETCIVHSRLLDHETVAKRLGELHPGAVVSQRR